MEQIKLEKQRKRTLQLKLSMKSPSIKSPGQARSRYGSRFGPRSARKSKSIRKSKILDLNRQLQNDARVKVPMKINLSK